MAVQKLSSSEVHALVGSELRKGQTLLDQGKLRHLARTDRKLYAEAAGSRGSTYRTSITFDDQGRVQGKRGRAGNCSCRAAWTRDFCKHAAALLLAWSKTPEAFAVTETPAEDEASGASGTGDGDREGATGPRKRSPKAARPKLDGDALKKDGAQRVDTLVRELAITGVGSASEQRVAQLRELAANLFQLQLRRLEERTLGLANLLARDDATRDSLRIASMLCDLLLTAARIKAHCDGKTLEDRYVTELVGRSWQAKDRTPVEGLDLLEYAYATYTTNKDMRVCASRMLALGSGEHYVEMQLTPKQILRRTPPFEGYAGRVLEGVHGSIFPGFAPWRIKPEGDTHRRRVTSADLERVVEHATSIEAAVAAFQAHRRDVFAPDRVPVLVRAEGLVAQGGRLRIVDEAGTTLHLRASAGLEQRMGDALEGRRLHAIFGELDLVHAIPTLWPSTLVVREPNGLVLQPAGAARRGDTLPPPRPWAEVAREAGLSYAAVSLGEVREELADLMVAGLAGLDARATDSLVERLQTLTLTKPAELLAQLARQPDPAQRVGGFVKLMIALEVALVKLSGAATLDRAELVEVPTHPSVYIPEPGGQLTPDEVMAGRLRGELTRYEAALHVHRYYRALDVEQMVGDLKVLADGGAAPTVVDTLGSDPERAVAVAERILALPMGAVPLRTAFALLTRAASPEAELILKAYSGKRRQAGRRWGQQVVHMADDALVELQRGRPRLSPLAEARRDHLEYKLGPLLSQARSDDQADQRCLACEALANLGATAAIPDLRRLFRTDRSTKVREQAALSLGQLGDAQIVEELLVAMRRTGTSKAKSMAHAACRALGSLGDSRALPALMGAYLEGFTPSVMADAWLRFGAMMLEPLVVLVDAQPDLTKRSALAAPLAHMPQAWLVDQLHDRLRGGASTVDLDDEAVAHRVVAYLRLCTDHPTARRELARRIHEDHRGGTTKAGKRARAAVDKARPSSPLEP